MLTRMAPLLTRMARMARLLTRMTRWLADSHIIHTHVMVETISTPAVALRGDRARTGLERATGLERLVSGSPSPSDLSMNLT